MATIITTECINCGACEPECPNTAIYGGGVPWEMNGATNPAIAPDIYYIVPAKCTECVGFHDHEACAAVCPVDCCIPDPNNPETESVLLDRARALHPGDTFPDDAPSRFRKTNAAPAPAAVASDGASTPTVVVPAPKSQPAAAATAPSAASDEDYDPASWEVPVSCKDCNEPFSIPYRHFQAGVVFYCPNCSGSFVPNTTLCRDVREAFEGFYGRRQRESARFEARHAKEIAEFAAQQVREADAFAKKLQAMANSAQPAGKLVRPKGLASMFT